MLGTNRAIVLFSILDKFLAITFGVYPFLSTNARILSFVSGLIFSLPLIALETVATEIPR